VRNACKEHCVLSFYVPSLPSMLCSSSSSSFTGWILAHEPVQYKSKEVLHQNGHLACDWLVVGSKQRSSDQEIKSANGNQGINPTVRTIYHAAKILFLGGAASSHPLKYINSWEGADWCGLNLNNFEFLTGHDWERAPETARCTPLLSSETGWRSGSHLCTSSWCRLAAQVLLRGEWGGGQWGEGWGSRWWWYLS